MAGAGASEQVFLCSTGHAAGQQQEPRKGKDEKPLNMLYLEVANYAVCMVKFKLLRCCSIFVS